MSWPKSSSTPALALRAGAIIWNLHDNYHRSRGAHDGQQPASAAPVIVNNVMTRNCWAMTAARCWHR